jgi:hypothetical protein
MSTNGGNGNIKPTGRPASQAKAVMARLLIVVLWFLPLDVLGRQTVLAQEAEPRPTVDPLDVPEMPDNPTQVDVGRISYFYNCMPCHGDHGQGLTDEWRLTWVEDHQNCWARGCHGGRMEDEGFPLPATIPSVAGPDNTLIRFSTPDELHDYLLRTHPPQRPGALPDDEYWALTAFMFSENGRILDSSAFNDHPSETGPVAAVFLVLGVLVGALAVAVLFGLRLSPSQK